MGRHCDECGTKTLMPRRKVGSLRVCDECADADAVHYAVLRAEAHDSGDGETIYHCPFCGSGNVVARSDGTAECGHCDTVFTVQVQPSHPFTPQTINGQPYNDPDMPGQVTDPAGSQPQQPPENEPAPGNESLIFTPPGQGESFDPTKSQQIAAAKLAASDGPTLNFPPDRRCSGGPRHVWRREEESDAGIGEAFRCENCRMLRWKEHSSAKKAYYLTAAGDPLAEEDFVRHVAIRHADDRKAVIAEVRAERN